MLKAPLTKKRPLGRPRKHLTVDEQIAARKANRAKSKIKTKNVTLDNDVLAQIYAAQAILKKELGFEPTLSQTIRATIARAFK